MKNFSVLMSVVILFIFIVKSNNIYSQVDFPICVAFDTTKKSPVKNLSSYSNKLYLGVDNLLMLSNFIVIDEKLVNKDTFIVSSDNGHIFRENKNRYLLIPSKQGKLVITVKSAFNNSIILVHEFEVIPIPVPFVTLGSTVLKNGAKVSKKQLLELQEFTVRISSDIPNDTKYYRVNDFTLGFMYGQMYVNLKKLGNKLSNEMVTLLNNVAPGKEIDLKFYITPDGDLVKSLPPIKIILQ